MSFDERFARRLKSAAESVPGAPLEFSEVMDRARDARRRYIAAVAAAVVLLLTATTGTLLLRDTSGAPVVPPADEGEPTVAQPEPTEADDCSAGSMSSVPDPPAGKLPAATQQTRLLIVEAASACDYDELARIGLGEGDSNFAWTVGDSSPSPPARFWRREERLGTQPLGNLVRLLNMNFVVERYGGKDHYVWPTAQRSSGPTAEDLAALVELGVLTEKEAAAMGEAGSYYGWRLSISQFGDWEYYTAGDLVDIEEALRASFAAAAEGLPGAQLDCGRTMEVARRLWMKHNLWIGGWFLAGAALLAALLRL